MAAVALALTWAGLWPFACLVACGALVLAWEWARVTGNAPTGVATLVQGAALVAASALAAYGRPAAALALVIGASAAVIAVSLARDEGRPMRLSALGTLYFGLPAVVLIALRGDPLHGLYALLFLFLVVWSEDTAAYLFGRLIGGPKLAPAISPGKTWSGCAAGLIVPALVALAFAAAVEETNAAVLAAVALALALAAQLGDLGESAIKRAFGRKDSSGLIPGHGGLLDRVDGLIAAAVAAGFLVLLRDRANPGSALLIW